MISTILMLASGVKLSFSHKCAAHTRTCEIHICIVCIESIILKLPQGLDEQFDKTSILGDLVNENLEKVAETWMIKLGREYQSVYVEQCIAQDRLKSAFIAVRTFRLEDEFPNVEGLYRQKTVARLLGKRLWAVASKVVGSDVSLQTMLLKQASKSKARLMSKTLSPSVHPAANSRYLQ